MPTFSQEAIKQRLVELLAARFDGQELQTLCFYLGVEYENLPAEGTAYKARELVRYLDRRDRLLECVETGKRLRPDIDWENVSPQAPKQLPANYLPPKAYDFFTGRAQELENLIQRLESDKYRLIALYGLGGIGKTALAREAVDQSLQKGRFHHVVWISAQPERFEGIGAVKSPVADLTFASLLDDIARQCRRAEWIKLSAAEKRQRIQEMLAAQPTLIVLDNLETVTDYETLIGQAAELLRGPSKLLLTSRHEALQTNVNALRLGGLCEEDSIAFLQQEARSRGISSLADAPRETWAEIGRVTGGAPLAMKLVVGQLGRQPLRVVLNQLCSASSASQDYAFYRFVFKHSWDMLSLAAKQALVSMSVFDAATGSPVGMAQQVSKLDEATFYPATDELIAMSLVNFGGEWGKQRYTLHPLTHYFILSDIVKRWE